jgi:DNA-directed RNA polymerase sigma subunit (sigma70/sigma32)
MPSAPRATEESHHDDERLIDALVRIEAGAAQNVERSLEVQRRVRWLRDGLAAGRSIDELIRAEAPPRTVELLSENMATLEQVGADFRASLALALRAEGLTLEAIAELFGVTRQRISALLRQRAAIKPT